MLNTDLVERLAAKVHESWQEEKHKQGIYNHPDDIPYSELTNDIQEYDRVTVRAVLNALDDLGYNVLSK